MDRGHGIRHAGVHRGGDPQAAGPPDLRLYPPVFPGVLQLEAMAQMSASVLMPLEQYKDKLFFYAGIDGVRFRKQVKPGDRFDMEAELVKLKGPIAKAHAKGFVDGQLAVEADLMFSIVGNK